ncbi:hypothetical protein Dimus_005545, partial [Dionaea muscipula]
GTAASYHLARVAFELEVDLGKERLHTSQALGDKKTAENLTKSESIASSLAQSPLAKREKKFVLMEAVMKKHVDTIKKLEECLTI